MSSANARAEIRDLLRKNPEGLTCRQIAEIRGTTPSSAAATLRSWKEDDPNSVHIAGWSTAAHVVVGGRRGAVWKLGPGEDVPCPRASSAERSRVWRKRNKALHAMRKRTRGQDPWAAGALLALTGAA